MLILLLIVWSFAETSTDQLRLWQEQLRSRKVLERVQALEAMVEHVKNDPQPSPQVAKLAARAVQQESIEVKLAAVTLLTLSPHRLEAVEALCWLAGELRKEIAGLGRGSNRGELSVDEKELLQKVVRGLAQLPDDRSVKAVQDLIQNAPQQAPLVELFAEALVALQARSGIAAVVQQLSNIGTRLARAQSQPDRGQRLRTAGDRLHQLLFDLADSLELQGMPRHWSARVDREWRDWFAANQKHFPKKLGRVKDRLADERRDSSQGSVAPDRRGGTDLDWELGFDDPRLDSGHQDPRSSGSAAHASGQGQCPQPDVGRGPPGRPPRSTSCRGRAGTGADRRGAVFQ
jgi:hypothetical protein